MTCGEPHHNMAPFITKRYQVVVGRQLALAKTYHAQIRRTVQLSVHES